MRNSRGYRLNAAEFLVAATSCQGDYRGLLVCVAAGRPLASWRWPSPAAKPDRCWPFNRLHRPPARYTGATHFAPVGTGATRSTPSLSSLANVAPATTGGLEQGTGSVSARQAPSMRRNIQR